MEEYNLQRAKKRNSNAPSREEIKERVEQGIARNDGAQLAHREHRKEQEERDKEREKERDKEKDAQRSAKKNKALDKSNRLENRPDRGGSVGPAMLTSHSTPVLSAKGPHTPHNPHNPSSRSVTKNKDHNRDNRDNNRGQNGDQNGVRKHSNGSQNSGNGSNNGSQNGSKNGSLNGSLNGFDEDDGYSGDDQGENKESKGQKIGVKKSKALRGRVSPRNKPGAQGMKRIAEEEIELYSESESVSLNPHTLQSVLDSPSSLLLTDFSHRENSITVFSPISQDTDIPFLRKSKDSNGSGELTEKSKNGSVKNKKSKRDKEKEKENMINDFNFSFENTAEPSLIDDLDDSLLAKKNNKNNSLRNKVKFTGKEGSSHGGSKQDFSRDHPLLRDSQLRETHISGLIGPQWVSEVLESDEHELGLLMMYSEGFSMFMAEEGIILDAPAVGTVW